MDAAAAAAGGERETGEEIAGGDTEHGSPATTAAERGDRDKEGGAELGPVTTQDKHSYNSKGPAVYIEFKMRCTVVNARIVEVGEGNAKKHTNQCFLILRHK